MRRQAAVEVDWESFLAPLDMEWVVKPVSWDEGAFFGNGLLGAMVYGEEHAAKRHVLRFVAGRTDVVAARPDGRGFPPRVPVGDWTWSWRDGSTIPRLCGWICGMPS